MSPLPLFDKTTHQQMQRSDPRDLDPCVDVRGNTYFSVDAVFVCALSCRREGLAAGFTAGEGAVNLPPCPIRFDLSESIKRQSVSCFTALSQLCCGSNADLLTHRLLSPSATGTYWTQAFGSDFYS